MNSNTKSIVLAVACVTSVVLLPVVLALLGPYFYAIAFIFSLLSCTGMFGYVVYTECREYLDQQQIEEENIFHQFNGDKQKIRFYKGFKKYFDGDVSLEGLEKWLEHHR